MRHHRVEQWEARLNALLKRVDHALEERFGDLLTPHPARPPHGTTANPQYDGLFRVTAAFTAGFGSSLGKGYVLSIEPVSLEPLPKKARAKIEATAVQMIQEGLEEALPGRGLRVERDGTVWKIVGDLSLANPQQRAAAHPPQKENT
ncbi:MAG TPA: hypothetical protein PLH01_05580 [Kiritimatiellia bacterium]|nr:hypothetical protein [Kiritimatiellia bacterium]